MLTVEYYWVCASANYYSRVVKGSNGERYKVVYERTDRPSWSCTCPAFKFRKTCKHIKNVRETTHCGWNEYADGGDVIDVLVDDEHTNGKACPECGCGVESVGFGV